MILLVNTVKSASIELGLLKNGQLKVTKYSISQSPAEVLLKKVDFYLKNQGIDFKNLTTIAVVIGPGGFSAVRSGVVFANTVAAAGNLKLIELHTEDWQDPVVLQSAVEKSVMAKKFKASLKPLYDGQPNITLKK